MTDSFDLDEFEQWLKHQELPLPKSTLYDEFPNFPGHRLIGVTCPMTEDGEIGYYLGDLHEAAYGQYPKD